MVPRAGDSQPRHHRLPEDDARGAAQGREDAVAANEVVAASFCAPCALPARQRRKHEFDRFAAE